jgi:hypothetical protein
VIDSSNASGVPFFWNGGAAFDRPNQVGDPNRAGPVAANPGCVAPSQVHTLANWFNPCAFEKAPAGELGTAARAPIYGPRFVNTDFSVVKNFPFSFREGTSLQFRAEFFNIFNHPQFYLGGDGGFGAMQNIAAPTSFGLVNTTVNNPRVVQFALKLKF